MTYHIVGNAGAVVGKTLGIDVEKGKMMVDDPFPSTTRRQTSTPAAVKPKPRCGQG